MWWAKQGWGAESIKMSKKWKRKESWSNIHYTEEIGGFKEEEKKLQWRKQWKLLSNSSVRLLRRILKGIYQLFTNKEFMLIPVLISCRFFCLCCRYKKLEEQRVEKEHQFYLEQAKLENERREEREHELKIFSMLIGNQNHPSSSSSFPQLPSSNESFVQNQYSNDVV